MSEIVLALSSETDAVDVTRSIRACVNDHEAGLPSAAERPTVWVPRDGSPPLQYWLVSDALSLEQLREVSESTIGDHLSSLSSAAHVETCGGRVPRVIVELEPKRLRAYGLDATVVADAVQRATTALTGGRLIELAPAVGLDALGKLMVTSKTGKAVPLASVAAISRAAELESCRAFGLDGREGVIGNIEVAASDVVRVRNALLELPTVLPPQVSLRLMPSRSDPSLAEMILAMSPDGVAQLAAVLRQYEGGGVSQWFLELAPTRGGRVDDQVLEARLSLQLPPNAAETAGEQLQSVERALLSVGVHTFEITRSAVGSSDGFEARLYYESDHEAALRLAVQVARRAEMADDVISAWVPAALATPSHRAMQLKFPSRVQARVVRRVAQSALYGIFAGSVSIGSGRSAPVVVRTKMTADPAAQRGLPVVLPDGTSVAMDDLATFTVRRSPPTIRRHDGRRYVSIVMRFAAGRGLAAPSKWTEGVTLPSGVAIEGPFRMSGRGDHGMSW